MKTDEVPQETAKTYAGNRKLLYAVSSDGEYEGVQSAGWEVETYATLAAVELLDKMRNESWARVKAGAASPLEYHMYQRRMEPATLAAAMHIWRWRLSRHLKPGPFAKLSENMLQRYSDVLGISVDALKRLPPTPEG